MRRLILPRLLMLRHLYLLLVVPLRHLLRLLLMLPLHLLHLLVAGLLLGVALVFLLLLLLQLLALLILFGIEFLLLLLIFLVLFCIAGIGFHHARICRKLLRMNGTPGISSGVFRARRIVMAGFSCLRHTRFGERSRTGSGRDRRTSTIHGRAQFRILPRGFHVLHL